MAVVLGPARPLEDVQWPTGEPVKVLRPNLFAAEHWGTHIVPAFDDPTKAGELRDGLVTFVAMVCPDKTEQQIREECNEDFLWLVANYARDRLEVASRFLDEVTGKTQGAAADPAPPAPTGTSAAALPEPVGAPSGS